MQVTATGASLATVLLQLVESAKNLKVTTTSGDTFSTVDAAIQVGYDYLNFNTSNQGESVTIRLDAIVSVTVS